jgi:hypothetical protein
MPSGCRATGATQAAQHGKPPATHSKQPQSRDSEAFMLGASAPTTLPGQPSSPTDEPDATSYDHSAASPPPSRQADRSGSTCEVDQCPRTHTQTVHRTDRRYLTATYSQTIQISAQERAPRFFDHEIRATAAASVCARVKAGPVCRKVVSPFFLDEC